MMGQVTALTSNGFVLTDATGSIFSYGKKSYEIGQELVATGAIGAYNKGFQLTTNKTTFLEGAVKAYTYPEAATADAAAIDAFIANTDNRLATYVTLTGDLSISGNYYNMTIEGTTNMGSIYYPNDAIKAALSTGTNITVKGYAMAISGGKYYNVIATEAVTNYVIPKITPAATSMSFVAEGEVKTNELTVAGQGELSLFAKSSDEHFTAAIEGTMLTVTAAANTTTEAKSATVTVYMAESAEAEAVASVEIACSQAAPSSGEDGGETTETWIVEEFTGLNKVYAGTLAFTAKQLTWTLYGCSSRNTTDQAAFPTADAAFTMGKTADNTATGDASITNAYCESAAIAKGVSKLKFDYCGNGKKFKVQVLVGGVVKFEKEFDAYNNTSVTKSSGELAITGATENAVIRFINTSGARRVTIGNISWVTAQ